MGILDLLFGTNEKLEKVLFDQILGELRWSEDDEAWFGKYKKYDISIAYEHGGSPGDKLLDYARSILSENSFLEDNLKTEKEKYIKANPKFKEEVISLHYVFIHFYRYNERENRILADLGSCISSRSWRIEYCEMLCEGIGFDS